MKKLFISTIALCLFLNQNSFSQSTLIQPANDEILTTKYGGTEPNLAGRHSSGSSTTPTATSAGLGLVTFSGRGYTGSSFTTDKAQIKMSADELFSTTANGTRITFSTTLNGTTTMTERVRIDNTGKVGIGSADPLGKLQINHDTEANDDYPHIRLRQLNDSNFGRIRFENSDGTRYFANKIGLSSLTAANNNYMWTYGTSELMRLTGDGKLGIGTTVPSKKLHVSNGSAGISSYVSTSNFLVEDNGSHYIQMGSPEVNETGIVFGKPSNSASGGVIYNGSNGLNLRTGGNITRLTITSAGNVGVGTSSPTAKLDIEGDIVVKKTTITTAGTYNALNRSSGSSLYINAVGTVTVNGIDAGVDGMILYLICGSSTTLVLANENASAATSDRIATHTGANVTISGRGGATLIYEGSGGRWRIVGVAQ